MKVRSWRSTLWVLTTGLLLSLVVSTGAAHASRSPSPGPRIVGGVPTSGADHPWQVTILGTLGRNEILCGGVLIAPRLVLTAGHCLPSHGSLSGWSMYAGSTHLLDWASAADGERLVLSPTHYWRARGFRETKKSVIEDYGIVELARAASSTPLRIAGTGEATTWSVGKPGVVTGFGLTDETSATIPETLRQVSVPVLDSGACSRPQAYGSMFYPSLMLCAGYVAGGKDACSGDSGGPFQVQSTVGDVTTPWLAALVSWGWGCAEPGHPGVYTKIADPALATRLRYLIHAHTDIAPSSVFGPGPEVPTCAAARSALVAPAVVVRGASARETRDAATVARLRHQWRHAGTHRVRRRSHRRLVAAERRLVGDRQALSSATWRMQLAQTTSWGACDAR